MSARSVRYSSDSTSSRSAGADSITTDTNPAEEGTDSWIWKLWYWFRTVDLDNLSEDAKEELNLNGLSEEELAQSIDDLKAMQADIAAELKVGRNRLTPEQAGWMDDLKAAGMTVHEWRPTDWADIQGVLE